MKMLHSKIFYANFVRLNVNPGEDIYSYHIHCPLITVATRSEACTAFARLNTGIIVSNRTRGIDVCMCLFCVCVVLCVGSVLAAG
jgi:hypothetical protein